MTGRLLLRCVASRSVLPRERFSPLALFGLGAVSDLSPLTGSKADVLFAGSRSPGVFKKPGDLKRAFG